MGSKADRQYRLPSLDCDKSRTTCLTASFLRENLDRFPPPRTSRVGHHPPQVSGLPLAHPRSPMLTFPSSFLLQYSPRCLAVARGVVRFLISFYSSPSLR